MTIPSLETLAEQLEELQEEAGLSHTPCNAKYSDEMQMINQL